MVDWGWEVRRQTWKFFCWAGVRPKPLLLEIWKGGGSGWAA